MKINIQQFQSIRRAIKVDARFQAHIAAPKVRVFTEMERTTRTNIAVSLQTARKESEQLGLFSYIPILCIKTGTQLGVLNAIVACELRQQETDCAFISAVHPGWIDTSPPRLIELQKAQPHAYVIYTARIMGLIPARPVQMAEHFAHLIAQPLSAVCETAELMRRTLALGGHIIRELFNSSAYRRYSTIFTDLQYFLPAARLWAKENKFDPESANGACAPCTNKAHKLQSLTLILSCDHKRPMKRVVLDDSEALVMQIEARGVFNSQDLDYTISNLHKLIEAAIKKHRFDRWQESLQEARILTPEDVFRVRNDYGMPQFQAARIGQEFDPDNALISDIFAIFNSTPEDNIGFIKSIKRDSLRKLRSFTLKRSRKPVPVIALDDLETALNNLSNVQSTAVPISASAEHKPVLQMGALSALHLKFLNREAPVEHKQGIRINIKGFNK